MRSVFREIRKKEFHERALVRINLPYKPENLISAKVFSDPPMNIAEINKSGDTCKFKDNNVQWKVSTKIKDGEITNTIYLDYVSRIDFGKQVISLPKFVTSVKGHKIDFFLSLLNFNSKRNGVLDIDYFYSGDRFYKELGNKRLVIVEPNWGQLDKLFLEEKVVFTDWK